MSGTIPKRREKLRWLLPKCSLALACSLAAPLSWAGLHIDLSTGNPGSGSATLHEAPTGLYGTRNDAGGQNIQATRCSERGALEATKGVVSVVDGCGVLSWQFGLAPYPERGAVSSEQLSWFAEDGSWWVVSEGSSILRRLSGAVARHISFSVDGHPLIIRAGPHQLPEFHEAPGFWLLGDPASLDLDTARHFFDKGSVPEHLMDVLERHDAGIAFLTSALPRRAPSPVFWMGLADWRLSIGGAAGTGLILANYPLIASELDETASAFSLFVVLHEHGHELFDGTGMLWLNESLASFLAIKSVEQTSPDLFPILADAFVEPGNALQTPLPIISQRASAGDGQAYGQLYMGAAFWKGLDEAMLKAGCFEGLVPVLSELLALGLDPNGVLRPEVTAEITGIAQEELAEILGRYLGVSP